MKRGNNRTSQYTESPDDRVRRLAARQFGVVSRAQVLGAGVSPDRIKYLVRAGDWARILPSVYAMASAPRAWAQPLMAGLLWAGPSAVISHRAAAAVWKLDGIDAGIVELTAAERRTVVPTGVVLHFARSLGRWEFGRRGPFLVTSLARTVVDLAAVLADPAVLEAAAESASRLDPELWAKLAARFEHRDHRGQRGIQALREILAARDPAEAPTESMLETRLLRLIRAAGLPTPVRQLVVPTSDSQTPRVDFAYPDHHLVIEADSYWCHSGRKQWSEGLERGNALVVEGWRPIHVTWEALTRRPDKVVADIRRALARQPGSGGSVD